MTQGRTTLAVSSVSRPDAAWADYGKSVPPLLQVILSLD